MVSRPRCCAVRRTDARTCWVCAPRGVRLPPPHILRVIDRGPERVLGAPVGGVERGIEEEAEDGLEFGGEMGGEAARVGEPAGARASNAAEAIDVVARGRRRGRAPRRARGDGDHAWPARRCSSASAPAGANG